MSDSKFFLVLFVLTVGLGMPFVVGRLVSTDAPQVAAADQYADTAAAIRKMGWHCPKVWSIKRVRVNADASKEYRIACGGSGPFYITTVYPDGRQGTRPE